MLGSVADDFTGATDLAGNWRSRGLKTAVLLGIPPAPLMDDLDGYDALVVAQKIRSVDADAARTAARRAGEVLLDVGCTQIYDKYCSTFDSTPDGNIGPIADELAELTGAERAIIVPSFPDAGRTVYKGHHFVLDELLSESPMRHHPLNPMTDSSVVRLMEAQTDRPVGKIVLEVVRQGPDALRAALDEVGKDAFYIVVDAIDNDDLRIISEATTQEKLVTGGSGIALGLSHRDTDLGQVEKIDGRKLVLSGSASAMTQRQVAHGKAHLPHRKADVRELLTDMDHAVAEACEWVRAQWAADPDVAPLIYSVESREDVDAARAITDEASSLIETYFGRIAADLSDDGLRQIVVAGGETSGSVCEALDIRILDLGEQLAPGVSWLLGKSDSTEYNIVLKSGNFGHEDLFTSAWGELR